MVIPFPVNAAVAVWPRRIFLALQHAGKPGRVILWDPHGRYVVDIGTGGAHELLLLSEREVRPLS